MPVVGSKYDKNTHKEPECVSNIDIDAKNIGKMIRVHVIPCTRQWMNLILDSVTIF